MKKIHAILSLLLISMMTFADNIPTNYREVTNLAGNWKFTIGDNMEWAQPNFNDANWESIYVPSPWENKGFPGYDGFAWYRNEVFIGSEYKQNTLHLFLGYIDDVDEVFFNGVKIGQKGAFPPKFWTAYNAERRYAIPAELIRPNQKNCIAIRVYDSQLEGGIVHGNVGIYVDINQMPSDLNLEGYWKFKLGDNMDWMTPDFDDQDWKKIKVPGTWEDQVSKNYDGFGWYRKQFNLDGSKTPTRYVLMLGKIDDLDEAYLNGKRIGATGVIHDQEYKNKADQEYSYMRYYYLNAEDVYTDRINTLAVRVYDTGGLGGIYEGPIGIIELKRFVMYWRQNNKFQP